MGTFIFIVILIFGAAIIQVCWKSNQTKNQGKELEEIINSVSDFTPTKRVIGINNQFVFMVDNNRKKIFYSNHITQKTISYNDIIKVEVIDNGKTIHQKSTIRTIGESKIIATLTTLYSTTSMCSRWNVLVCETYS